MKPKDDQKIHQIFKATTKLVVQYGLAGITMSEIAREASIGTGTLYIYFESKEKLINELFTSLRQTTAEMYFKDYDSEESFEQCFKRIWHNIVSYRIKRFEDFVFIDQCFHSPFISETTKEITKKMFEPFYELIERGKREQKLQQVSTILLITFMLGSINEVIKLAHYSNKKLDSNTVKELFSMCWKGMKK